MHIELTSHQKIAVPDSCTLSLNGNSKPTGDHDKKKIDGVISKLNCLGGYLSSVYGSNEAFVIPYSNNS